MQKVSLYDFDRTIYPKDTGTNLYFFVFKKYPFLWLYALVFLISTLLHTLHLLPHGFWKNIMLLPMRHFSLSSWNKLVEEFWQKEASSLFPRVLAEMHKDKQDGMLVGIISASLELYLQPIIPLARPDFIIGTKVKLKGENICSMDGANCKGEEKVRRFQAYMQEHYLGQEYVLEKMVSDSLHDLPLYQAARQSYTVEADGSLREGLPKAYSNDLSIK